MPQSEAFPHKLRLVIATSGSSCRSRRLFLLLLLLLSVVLLLPSTTATAQAAANFNSELQLSSATVPQAAAPCARSFTQAFFDLGSWFGMLNAFAQLCPADCLNPALHNLTGAVVLGSFPYHPSSSVCLSAIHSGLLNASLGGAVWISIFWSQRWDEAEVDIYPHQAARGSYSHGVQSLPVPQTEPLTLDSYSYVLHGRGAVFNQRRWAPWTARAGHLHLASDDFKNRVTGPRARWGFHLIAGGRNASHHYLNDVWLYVTRVNESQPMVSSNGRWFALPAAPWSPRAFMTASSMILVRDISPDQPGSNCFQSLLGCQLNVTIIGGEVGYSCGLPELGRCVAEAWQLTVVWASDQPPYFSLQWSEKATQLPFPAVCGSLHMATSWTPSEAPYLSAVGGRTVRAVMGGQLSYEDASCSSPPVSSNSVWYSDNVWPFASWKQGADAPWSPRRSMLTQTDYAPADFSVMGGVRYDSFACDGATGRCRLTAAQLFADVYICNLAMNGTADRHCDWTPSRPRQSSNTTLWGPAGSLPVPLAYLPQGWTGGWHDRNEKVMPGVVFGGVSSAAGLQGWYGSNVSGVEDGQLWSARASMIEQPDLLGSTWSTPTLDDVLVSRYGQPLVYNLSEAELNDDSGMFRTGVPGLVTAFIKNEAPAFTSAHQLLSQQFSTFPYSYSAASPDNTSRALLDFVYTRHSYGIGVISNILQENRQLLSLSGGASGGECYNDWVELQQVRSGPQGAVGCFSADDPSYSSLLGPGRVSNCRLLHSNACYSRGPNVAYCPSYQCDWRCEGDTHLDPPSGSEMVTLSCMADGVWQDAELLLLRRCVANRLNCSHPLVDMGGAQCEEPEPFISRIAAGPASASTAAVLCTAVDALTVDNCDAEELALEISGGWFTFPLQVWVGGHECQYPQLRDVDGNDTACGSAGSNGQCTQYATRVLCLMPVVGGVSLPVVVQSGPHSRLAESRDWRDNTLPVPKRPSLSYAAPSIISLDSANCSRGASGSVLQLVDCPSTHSFSLTVKGRNLMPRAREGFVDPLLHTRVVLSGIRTEQLECGRSDEVALNCTVPPGLGSGLPLLISVDGYGDNSYQAVANATTRPFLSYADCPAGTFTNYTTAATAMRRLHSLTELCPKCAAGTSTDGQSNAQQCKPCAAGRYNNGTGHGACELCPAGTWSAAGSAVCSNCSLNSYSLDAGVSVCDSCSLNQYVSYSADNSSWVQCLPCLSAATCWPNGSITAAFGSFIVIDSALGSISAAACRGSACWEGTACLQSGSDSSDAAAAYLAASPRIPLSGLPIINCCASGRVPAADNLLCAECLPQYAEWNGSCVRCEGVSVLALSGVLLLAGLLLYCLHRLPQSLDSSWLSQLLYYLQMSLLFATHDTVPQLLSLVNFDLLGDFHNMQQQTQQRSSTPVTPLCIAPLTAYDKIGLHVVMPLAFVLGIVLIFLLQLSCRCLLFRSGQHGQPRMRHSEAVYRWLFTAADDDIEKERQAAAAGEATVCTSQAATKSRAQSLVAPLLAYIEPEPVDQLQDKPSATSAQPSADHSAVASARSAGLASFSSSSSFPVLWGVPILAYNRTLLRLLLYSYNGASLAILSFFHCQPLDSAHGSRLYSYPSVDCTSAAYRALLPAFVCGLLLLVLGGPVALLLLLWRQRRVAAALHAAEAADAEQAAAGRIAYARYGLLYASYRAPCWYWSCVVLLQRALLISTFVFVQPQPAAFTALSALNLSILTTQLAVQPYRSAADNRREAILQFCLCLQTIMHTLYPPSGVTNTVAAVFSAIVILPPVALKTAVWAANRRSVSAARCLHWLRTRYGCDCTRLLRAASLQHFKLEDDADDQL